MGHQRSSIYRLTFFTLNAIQEYYSYICNTSCTKQKSGTHKSLWSHRVPSYSSEFKRMFGCRITEVLYLIYRNIFLILCHAKVKYQYNKSLVSFRETKCLFYLYSFVFSFIHFSCLYNVGF